MLCTFCILCKWSATSKLTTADFSCHCQVKVLKKASGEKAMVEASGDYKLAVIGKMKLQCAYLQVIWATMSRQLEPQGSKKLYFNLEENLWLQVKGNRGYSFGVHEATGWGLNGDQIFFHLSQLMLGSTPHLSQVKLYIPWTILLMSSIIPCKTTRAKTKVDKKANNYTCQQNCLIA